MTVRYKRWVYSPKQAAKGTHLAHMVIDHGDGTPELTLCSQNPARYAEVTDQPHLVSCRSCLDRLPDGARAAGLHGMLAHLAGGQLERVVPMTAKEEALCAWDAGDPCARLTLVLALLARDLVEQTKHLEAHAATGMAPEDVRDHLVLYYGWHHVFDRLGLYGVGRAEAVAEVNLEELVAALTRQLAA